MGKRIKYLVIHCTATPEGRPVYPDDIERWHTDPCELPGGKFRYKGKTYNSVQELPLEVQPAHRRGRGWKQIGYRDIILLTMGLLINMVRHNDDDIVDPWEITNGVAGINDVSAHVVYVGGCDKDMNPKDTRTREQKETLKQYVRAFIARHPHIKVAGHNQFAAKDCPSFDVPAWLRDIGVAEENIYQP